MENKKNKTYEDMHANNVYQYAIKICFVYTLIKYLNVIKVC